MAVKSWVHRIGGTDVMRAVEMVDCFAYDDGRLHVSHRSDSHGMVVESSLRLGREQAEWLRDRLTDVLNETDPAYIAHMEKAAAMGEPALPATDDEWKARLVEGGVA